MEGPAAVAVLARAAPVLYARRDVYDLVGPPFAVYYRVYRDRRGWYGVFLLYEWPYQVVPPHRWDYEPVVVILDDRLMVRAVYVDAYHYYVTGYKSPPGGARRVHLLIDAPWRSMRARWTRPGPGYVWLPTPSPVYLSDRLLHELRARGMAVHERLVRDPFSVADAVHWSTFTEPTVDDVLRDLEKNYGAAVRVLLRRAREMARALAERVRATLAFLLGSAAGEREAAW